MIPRWRPEWTSRSARGRPRTLEAPAPLPPTTPLPARYGRSRSSSCPFETGRGVVLHHVACRLPAEQVPRALHLSSRAGQQRMCRQRTGSRAGLPVPTRTTTAQLLDVLLHWHGTTVPHTAGSRGSIRGCDETPNPPRSGVPPNHRQILGSHVHRDRATLATLLHDTRLPRPTGHVGGERFCALLGDPRPITSSISRNSSSWTSPPSHQTFISRAPADGPPIVQ